jgi:hypothetical protein
MFLRSLWCWNAAKELLAMNVFRQLWRKLRSALRARAFKRGRKMGMTVSEARAYANEEHPQIPAEAAYEEELRRKDQISN